MFLGSSVDADGNGQPAAGANGDDNSGNDDEDGVTFTSALSQGTVTTVDVVASAAGLLNAWVDFNADGDWADAGEQVFHDVVMAPGTNGLSFPVPADATVADTTYSRFRVSNQSGVTPSGLAPDGEVEDYAVSIVPGQVDATIVGRYIFYNASLWDDNKSAANASDDDAIAPDKQALLPGQDRDVCQLHELQSGYQWRDDRRTRPAWCANGE